MSLVGLGIGRVAIPQLMLLLFGPHDFPPEWHQPLGLELGSVGACKRAAAGKTAGHHYVGSTRAARATIIAFGGMVVWGLIGISSKGDKRTRVVGTFFRKTWQDLVSEIWGSVENVDSSQVLTNPPKTPVPLWASEIIGVWLSDSLARAHHGDGWFGMEVPRWHCMINLLMWFFYDADALCSDGF